VLPHQPGICLVMIVKDEAAVIERCLMSVRNQITTWRIIDTGSTDGTPELVAALLDGIPGVLRHEPWVDFGHNRSELVAWAQGSAQWLLLLDADHEAEFGEQFAMTLNDFEADQALVAVRETVHYRMPYLVRGDKAWKYQGRTHEYLTSSEPYKTAWFDQLVVIHHGDGGSKADKVSRDIKLLSRDLLDDPSNPRTHFYLAQSLRDSGDLHGAIDHYLQRIELGGWEEECFFSQYQVGLLQSKLGLPAATASLLSAWNIRPHRAEPMYQLARLARLGRRHHEAWLFSNAACALPFPGEDQLFVEGWIYEWGATFERCDAAWRIGDYELSRELATSLLHENGLPEDHRAHLNLILASIEENPSPR